MSRTAIVVPCYNEGNRFDGPAFDLALGDIPDLELVFVNDGSDDDTLIVLRAFEEKHPGRVRVIDLERNLGKSHAVRAGMLEALAGHHEIRLDQRAAPGPKVQDFEALDDDRSDAFSVVLVAVADDYLRLVGTWLHSGSWRKAGYSYSLFLYRPSALNRES